MIIGWLWFIVRWFGVNGFDLKEVFMLCGLDICDILIIDWFELDF